LMSFFLFFFFQAEDGIRDFHVTGVQTCALPILLLSVPSFCGLEFPFSGLSFGFLVFFCPNSATSTILGILLLGAIWRSLRILRRSEEHTSELQSRENLVCRLLLEKKKKKNNNTD